MTDSTHEYSLPGFSKYTVTENCKIFRIRELRNSRQRKEVAVVDDCVTLYSDEKTRHTYQLSRVILAAKNHLDPRDEQVHQIQEKELQDALLPSLAEKVDAVKDVADGMKLHQTEMIISDLEKTFLSILREQKIDNDAAKTLANMVAHDCFLCYKMWLQIMKDDSLTEIEISREGNERKSPHHLLSAYQKQRELVNKGAAQLGLDYSGVMKQVSITTSKVPEFFDDDVDEARFELI